MTDQATPLTKESEALHKAMHGSPCPLGTWCRTLAQFRRIEAAAALRAIEGSGVVEALAEELRPNCEKLRDVHGPLAGLGYAAALDDIAALAHPTLARVIAIGQAWVAAEEAVLGRGAGIEMTVRTLPGAGAVASWYDRVDGEGDRLPSEPTPEAALLALAAALTDQERGS